MSRQEVKRFVYMCDGMENVKLRCSSVQVVDAVNEKEADQIARDRGWRVSPQKGVLCSHKKHKKWARRPDRTAGLPSLTVVEDHG